MITYYCFYVMHKSLKKEREKERERYIIILKFIVSLYDETKQQNYDHIKERRAHMYTHTHKHKILYFFLLEELGLSLINIIITKKIYYNFSIFI